MKIWKKIIFLLAAFILVISVSAFAEETSFNSVKICFDGGEIPTVKEQAVEFKLYNESGNELLDSEIYEIKRGKRWFNIEFNISDFPIGTKFKLVLEGEGSMTFCNEEKKEHIVETYSAPDENGFLLYQTTFYMQFNPVYVKEAVIKLPGYKNSQFFHCVTDDDIYVTTDLLSALGIECKKEFNAEKPNFTLSADKYSAQFYLNDIYAVFGGKGENLYAPVFEIDGMPFVPLSKVATYFACNYTVEQETPYQKTISLTPSVYSDLYKKAEYINSIDIDSRTDYLVWISKKDFRVNVFIGENRRWRFVDSFPCAIGAPSTPTIEGRFEYIQKQSRWQYDGYYCGPIMRFYRGYALHSVLLRNNGSFYDGRVGVKISHGCIRMLPDDIKWMVDYIPLYSRILVTG